MSVDITIIIPSKDRIWSLPKAVESCRTSKLRMQIIVIDDGSVDGTADWLRTQPDILTVQGEGWGKPWGINKALPLATGKYLRYLDSDDWLNPGANEIQFEDAEQSKADISVAGMDIYDDELLRENQPWIPTDDFIAQQLGETPGSHYSAFLYRREFIRDIPHRVSPASEFASRDDRCFILEVALRHPQITVCPVSTLCHRHHTRARLQFHNGLRGTGGHIELLYIYRRILKLLGERGELTQRRKKAATKILWPLAHWIGYSHAEEACQVADWVFELDPEFEIPEGGALGNLYRHLGFRYTERILRMRRALIGLAKPKPRLQPLGPH
jgi:glycosyltransferase involved in cell wall biosynthesis